MLNENFMTHADATVFMKENVEALLNTASEPKNAKLIVMMGTPNIMKFLASCSKPAEQKQEQPKEQ